MIFREQHFIFTVSLETEKSAWVLNDTNFKIGPFSHTLILQAVTA